MAALPNELPPATLKTAITRFLFPFTLVDCDLDRITQPLAGTGWQVGDNVPESYQDNAVSYASRQQFARQLSYGRYLRFDPDIAKQLLGDVTVPLREQQFHICLHEAVGIELFLTRDGVAILSLAVHLSAPAGHALKVADVRDLNSNLHRGRNTSADHYGQCARLELGEASRQAFCDHLGCDPSKLDTLPAIRQALLSPLLEHLLPATTDTAQDSFLVFSVACFDDQLDFDRELDRRWAGAQLVGLRDHWPSDHAGAIEQQLPGAYRFFNRRHAASVGLQGGSAILADQGSNHPYDAVRISRAIDKHFFQLLFALVQRLTLHELRREAIEGFVKRASHVEHGVKDSEPSRNTLFWSLWRSAFEGELPMSRHPLQDVRRRLVEFGLAGQFSQSQFSESAQEYYELARQGLGVDEAWRETRAAIEEIDTKFATDRSVDSLSSLTDLQRKVEWAEVGIIGVYVLEASHIVFAATEHGLRALMFFLFAVVFGILAALLALRPHQHHSRGFRWGWLVVLFIALLVGGYWARHGEHDAKPVPNTQPIASELGGAPAAGH